MTPTPSSELLAELKRHVVESLNLEGLDPESIGDDTPLFGQGLGLDSVDALELVFALERAYGIQVQSHDFETAVFSSIASLGQFVAAKIAERNSGSECGSAVE